MIHLLKYRFLQIVREYSIMFWALAFPIILGTFYYFSFGSSGLKSTGEPEWEAIKTAVIEEDTSSDNARTFLKFLSELDGDALYIHTYDSESKAVDALTEGKVKGIYYVKETPSLTVSENGIPESILTSILDGYNQNMSMFQEISETHPEKIPEASSAMEDYRQVIREESLGGKSLDPNIQYFFALIAYACLSGAFLGVRASFDIQANLSPLGARRSITPTHKLKLVLVDMTVLAVIHFINILILNLYITQILGIGLGDNIPALLLVDFMGSTIGIAIGLAFGCISKLSLGAKLSGTVVITLVPGFLAGLMFGNMKNLIELHCPFINRINPAAVLSDAFYCLGIYNDMERFIRCIMILAGMTVFFVILAFLGIRRDCYDSI